MKKKQPKRVGVKHLSPLTSSDVRDMLACIPVPNGREDRMLIYSAVINTLGKNEAEGLLIEWDSSRNDREVRTDCKHPMREPTQAKLIHEAKKNGWSPTPSAPRQYTPRKEVVAPKPNEPFVAKSGPFDLREPTISEYNHLRQLRKLGPCICGLRSLYDLGILSAGTWSDQAKIGSGSFVTVPVFVLQDGGNAMCRRMDGNGWNCIPKGDKPAKNRPHIAIEGRAKWPIGASTITADTEAVIFVEGFPDMLAAATSLTTHAGPRAFEKVAIVAMYAANPNIHPDALPLFKGKVVRIFPHIMDSSNAGENAALSWRDQLLDSGAEVDIAKMLDIDGNRVKQDLNDLVSATYAKAVADNPDPVESAFYSIQNGDTFADLYAALVDGVTHIPTNTHNDKDFSDAY